MSNQARPYQTRTYKCAKGNKRKCETMRNKDKDVRK